MKSFLLSVAVVATLVLGGLMSSTAEAAGRGYYNYGHRPHCSPYVSHYGGRSVGYSPYASYRPYYGGGSGIYFARPVFGISIGW